jgi:hypothetical protein
MSQSVVKLLLQKVNKAVSFSNYFLYEKLDLSNEGEWIKFYTYSAGEFSSQLIASGLAIS